jgi:dihydrodipicolinate synthase/N-acetylneuraminate lyase
MKNGPKYQGAVVPMVTPVTADGAVDESAVDSLVESLVAGGVEGIFVLGTTGEGAGVPPRFRKRLLERVVRRVSNRCLVYAGLDDVDTAEIAAANEYLKAGANAIVIRPRVLEPVPAQDLGGWYRALLDQISGPVVLYNMPMTTGVSIPLDAIEELARHPKCAGIKDSENNAHRIEELLKRFGGRPAFSVFIGVGALMGKGLRLGADGIVPSVGNLIPDVCHQICAAAKQANWVEADTLYARMNAVAALYQKGRTLNESLSALKAAMHCLGLCGPHVLPPLKPMSELQCEKLRHEMERLHLLNGKS